MQARNREFRGQNAERESGRPDFEVGKAGSNPVSASEKGIQEKNLVSFFYALRPTGFLQIYELEKRKSIGMIGDQPIYNTKDTIKLGSIKALELRCEGADFFGML